MKWLHMAVSSGRKTTLYFITTPLCQQHRDHVAGYHMIATNYEQQA